MRSITDCGGGDDNQARGHSLKYSAACGERAGARWAQARKGNARKESAVISRIAAGAEHA